MPASNISPLIAAFSIVAILLHLVLRFGFHTTPGTYQIPLLATLVLGGLPRGHEFCGVGFWGLKFQPKEFSTILFRKYKGSFETDLRIRLRNGKNTFTSEVFRGYINPKQFYFEHRDMELDSFRKLDIDYLYLGAIPLEFDSLIEQPKMIPR